jgi:hypothetical protein
VSIDGALHHSLLESQQRIQALLSSASGGQDWAPATGSWSFREQAAHLATVQLECVQTRIRQIAAGDRPRFESYWNTGRDFSQLDLEVSLREWASRRQETLAFVAALSPAQLRLTGRHATFGDLTVSGYLRVDLDHDREHEDEIRRMVMTWRRGRADV